MFWEKRKQCRTIRLVIRQLSKIQMRGEWRVSQVDSQNEIFVGNNPEEERLFLD